MSIQISNPSEILAPYVKQYWSIENHVASGAEYAQRIIPCGLTELMFYLGDLPQASDNRKQIQDGALISGHQQEYYDLHISGTLSLFSIVFKPQGLMMFFDIPLNKLFNQNVSLRSIIQDSVEEMETLLFEANELKEKVKIAEKFLLNRIEKSTRLLHFQRISHCIDIINRSRGMVGIDYLASEACLSRKQFERIFSEYVGSTPKLFLKTVRFQSTLLLRGIHPELSLTSLALDTGYYDQSHMISDFKSFSGKTPKQYFTDSAPFSDYFQ